MMEAEKPELFGYYFQIPIKAEVKKVQISMLSSSVQEKIRQLGGRTKASFVVVVSPITIQKLPKSHKSRTTAAEHSPVTMSDTSQSSNVRSMGKADKQTKKDLGTYLVPVKCSKDIALAILQLAQTSKEDKSSSESESSNFSKSLVLNHNLQMIEMKAKTLYIYKNIMYLLPKSQEANTSDKKSEAEKSEATESQARAKLRNRKYKHKSLGCVILRSFSFRQQQDRRIVGSVTEKSATIVKSYNKERCDLPDEMKPIDVGPSSGSSTVKSLQVSFWEQSERQVKRKLPYLSNEQPFIKRNHQSDSDAKQDSFVAKNVLIRSPLQPHPLSSDAPSPLSPQESPVSFAHEKSSPCGYLSDSGSKQGSTVAKNVLTHYPLQPHSPSSDVPSSISPQESPASFFHEETSPCGYLSDSGAKQDSTVEKNVLYHSPLQTHPSSSDAPSPLSPQESPVSFSHEKTSPCGYLSDSGAKQNSTVAMNVLDLYPLQPHSPSSDVPSSLSPQESPASFFHEETSPCGYLSDSGPKQDSTVAKNVLDHSPLQTNPSSSDVPSPPSPEEAPASFSHEETPPRRKTTDLERISSSSSLLCNTPQHAAPTPLRYHPTCADNMSPPHLKAKSSLCWSDFTTGSQKSYDTDKTSSASDIDDTTRDEKRQRLLDRVIELKKEVEKMQQKSN
ncbi:proteoglycan 4-like [Bufo bufo]|uniref:proteoglycan 4-like n=1 Tax=Bufo bufo TaxID=8384 RepID=UPI001ABE7D87|nr:proteoglycan 4-like [Bufo bufo]XP_040282565.1 proteoglycan 4-like [Bufo bufo]